MFLERVPSMTKDKAPAETLDEQTRNRLLALLRYVVTRDDDDRSAALAIAEAIDYDVRLPLPRRSNRRSIWRTVRRAVAPRSGEVSGDRSLSERSVCPLEFLWNLALDVLG